MTHLPSLIYFLASPPPPPSPYPPHTSYFFSIAWYVNSNSLYCSNVDMNGTSNSHDPSSSLMERILFHLRDRQQQQTTTIEVTRKAIQKKLTSSSSSSDEVTKKDVKKALKQLVKRGDLMKNGKKYKLQMNCSYKN